MPTYTYTHESHSRERYNAKRDRTDEQVLADALAQTRSFLRLSPAEPVNEGALIAQERAGDRAWRIKHAQDAAEIAAGCAWVDARDAMESTPAGIAQTLSTDTFTLSVTVTDLIATATLTIPDLVAPDTSPSTTKDA